MVELSIKSRLLHLRKKQIDLVLELRRRGEAISESELSRIISGITVTAKAERVLAEIEQILSDWENDTTKSNKKAVQ